MSTASVISLASVVVAALGVGFALLAWREARRSAAASEASVVEARRSADAAEASVREAGRSASAAETAARSAEVSAEADRAADHRARTPRLDVVLECPAEYDGPDAVYRIRHQGPAALGSVIVHRPLTDNDGGGVVHPVAAVGGAYADTVDLGALPVTGTVSFILKFDSRVQLPPFHVRLECTAGDEQWHVNVTLPDPRMPKPVRPIAVFHPDRSSSPAGMEF